MRVLRCSSDRSGIRRRSATAVLLGALVIPLVLAPARGASARGGTTAAVRTPGPGGGQVLVRFAQHTGRAATTAALARVDGVLLGHVYGESTAIVRVPLGVNADAAARTLRSSAGVAWAERDGVARIAAPDDPKFPQQYGLKNTGQTGGLVDADVDAPEGWTAAGLTPGFPATGGTSIGFVDTGLDTAHPEFPAARLGGCVHADSGAILAGCGDGNGHGTHVAGIAAAATNNGVGVAGVAFDSPIYVCRALGAGGSGLDSDVAACIHWLADQGVRIINMSLTVGTPQDVHPAIVSAWNSGDGALLVAAAGNSGNTTVQYPAGFTEVVSVGNTNDSDIINPSSSHNADVELSAPGTNIVSTWNGQGYRMETGTSMASPVVAGVAAVAWQLQPPTTTALEIRKLLHASVDDLGAAGRDPSYGFGRINLCLAAGGSCTYTPGPPAKGTISGTVKTTTGDPLKARVAVVTGPTAASTRAAALTGEYSLPGLTPGAYSVRAKKKGCQALTKNATVTGSTTTKLNFVLTCS